MSPPEDRPTVRIRCQGCFDVVSCLHLWDRVSCGCGAVTVSGKPWAPDVHWLSSAGGGWSEIQPADDDSGLSDDCAEAEC